MNNNIFERPNNNIDDLMDNEISAALVPLRRREIDNRKKEKEVYFSPNKGNVIFASATDNWAFMVDKFVDIFAKNMA